MLKSAPPGVDWLRQDLARLLGQLDTEGVMAALKSLNARVAHRFTAVYKFQGEMQRAVFIYDKLGRPDACLNTVAVADSFSQFATPSRPFCVTDSATDDRLGKHRYRGVVASYYGVLLTQASGKPAGSLCHFDFNPQAMPAPEECVFLNRAKNLLLTRLNGFNH